MARSRRIPKKFRKFIPVLLIAVIIILIAVYGYGFFALKKNPVAMTQYLLSFVTTPTTPEDNGGTKPPSSFEGGTSIFDENTVNTVVDGDFSVHFLELGNKNTGDCVYVRAGEVDILIDAGSKPNSIPTIKSYLETYIKDDVLEYVIATHAHQDHIAGFAGDGTNKSLFKEFDCKTIIDFPMTNSTSKTYSRYLTERDAEIEAGAKHYTALECYNNQNGGQRVFTLTEQTTLTVLYNYYYENKASEENDYSVCVMITHAEKNYLFTGDLEADGEEYLVQYNEGVLGECELYKAGHHGSKTSSSTALLEVIKPKIVCVCCCAGNDEYSDVTTSQFPTQAFIDRIAPYTDSVYVTSLGDVNYLPDADKAKEFGSFNGTIILLAKSGVEDRMFFSNNSTKLKDSTWFKAMRTTPTAWAAV